MRGRLSALALALVLLSGLAATPVSAAPVTAEAGTVHAAVSCPGNFFSRLGLLIFQRSYASFVWLRYC